MSEDTVPRSGPGGPVRAVLVVTMWVLVATFAGLVAVTGAGASVDAVALDATVGLAAVWSAALVCWVAVGRARRRQRDVLLATGGVTAFAVGVGAYGVELALTGSVAIPSVGDLGYLLFYPFMLAAMVLAVR
ncbi:MAG TPA: hypothetical protein VN257_02260, partial [Actinotalea sp.]|nr:hypothetical protein [Actinotalea sp.]